MRAGYECWFLPMPGTLVVDLRSLDRNGCCRVEEVALNDHWECGAPPEQPISIFVYLSSNWLRMYFVFFGLSRKVVRPLSRARTTEVTVFFSL